MGNLTISKKLLYSPKKYGTFSKVHLFILYNAKKGVLWIDGKRVIQLLQQGCVPHVLLHAAEHPRCRRPLP